MEFLLFFQHFQLLYHIFTPSLRQSSSDCVLNIYSKLTPFIQRLQILKHQTNIFLQKPNHQNCQQKNRFTSCSVGFLKQDYINSMFSLKPAFSPLISLRLKFLSFRSTDYQGIWCHYIVISEDWCFHKCKITDIIHVNFEARYVKAKAITNSKYIKCSKSSTSTFDHIFVFLLTLAQFHTYQV